MMKNKKHPSLSQTHNKIKKKKIIIIIKRNNYINQTNETAQVLTQNTPHETQQQQKNEGAKEK
jgi:hypothetical protein